MDEVLGSDTQRTHMEVDHPPSWASLAEAETVILWLRNNLPEYADEILLRARQYYQNAHIQ